MPHDPTQPGQAERPEPSEVPAPRSDAEAPSDPRSSDALFLSGSRFDRIAHTRETMHKDGINSLTYRVVSKEKLDLYTRITVDVGKP